MIQRVRAVLVTPASQILLIRRERPGIATYWVLPGGHVEADDATLEDALRREVLEELAVVPEVHGLIQVLDDAGERQHIFLARIDRWSFPDRSGPEFAEAGRGRCGIDLVPATADSIARLDLKPAAIAQLLARALSGGGSLFTLPDLRMTGGADATAHQGR